MRTLNKVGIELVLLAQMNEQDKIRCVINFVDENIYCLDMRTKILFLQYTDQF